MAVANRMAKLTDAVVGPQAATAGGPARQAAVFRVGLGKGALQEAAVVVVDHQGERGAGRGSSSPWPLLPLAARATTGAPSRRRAGRGGLVDHLHRDHSARAEALHRSREGRRVGLHHEADYVAVRTAAAAEAL